MTDNGTEGAAEVKTPRRKKKLTPEQRERLFQLVVRANRRIAERKDQPESEPTDELTDIGKPPAPDDEPEEPVEGSDPEGGNSDPEAEQNEQKVAEQSRSEVD